LYATTLSVPSSFIQDNQACIMGELLLRGLARALYV
jgi:hypothetical protein